MRGHVLSAVALLVAASPASAQPPQPPAQLAITFAERAVAVSGATPNGEVAWFSVAREIRHFAARIVRREATTRASAAGVASFALDNPVPWQSIWVAVDETGAFAVNTPQGFDLRELALAADALRPGPGGADVVADAHDFLEVFLVRPRKGDRSAAVFGGTVGDGGASDEDRRSNGAVVLPLSRLYPVGDSAQLLPPVFSPDDVLAVIDPNAMAVKVTRVSPGARP